MLAALVLALPGFVSSTANRHTIENFASNLTGRQVSIQGKLSLVLLPRPEITATHITITGPDSEIITAKSLALEISLPALLHGQLAARALNLDSPTIAFPWPLPGGPKAVAPPPWLAALHAHIARGNLRIGDVEFTSVNADIFTGQNGAVRASGNGVLGALPLSFNMILGQLAADDSATFSIQASGAGGHFGVSGALDAQSKLTGQLTATLADGISGVAAITADGKSITASGIDVNQGDTSLTGTATFSFSSPALTADLVAKNLNLDTLLAQVPPAFPVDLSLAASNVTLGGHAFPTLQTDLSTSPAGVKIKALNLGLPGDGTVTGSLTVAKDGALTGKASLAVPDLPALLAAYALPAPPQNWGSAHLAANLSGTFAQPILQNLSGTLGTDHVTGTLVLTPTHADGRLSFDHLALASLASWVVQLPHGNFTTSGEINATHAEAGPVKLQNLAVDAALDRTLNIRRFSANLYGGLASGSFTLDTIGRISSAQGFIDLPSATPLAPLIPAAWGVPPALLAPRLNLVLAVRGPADALATGIVASLGSFTITATPTIDLTHGSASGALSLRHPNAIAAMKLLGLDQGIAFPGPGSIALRASFTASATQWGLNDFVLSFGALTANGRVLVNNNTLSGQIDADTLALPPIPASLPSPSKFPLQGGLSLSANRVLYAGKQILGPSTANLAVGDNTATLNLASASLGSGTLSGSLAAKLSPTALPAFSVKLLAQNISASAINLPIAFPYTLSTGTFSATAGLTASGYTPKLWVATLAGSATLTAAHGRLRGLSLNGITSALGKPGAERRLRTALESGTTPFSTLSLSCTFANGNCTLTQSSLTSTAGKISVISGSGIDVADSTLALRLQIAPAVNPPLSISMPVLGPWSAPKHIPRLKDALTWKPKQ